MGCALHGFGHTLPVLTQHVQCIRALPMPFLWHLTTMVGCNNASNSFKSYLGLGSNCKWVHGVCLAWVWANLTIVDITCSMYETLDHTFSMAFDFHGWLQQYFKLFQAVFGLWEQLQVGTWGVPCMGLIWAYIASVNTTCSMYKSFASAILMAFDYHGWLQQCFK
jgi:hypothetical protein